MFDTGNDVIGCRDANCTLDIDGDDLAVSVYLACKKSQYESSENSY